MLKLYRACWTSLVYIKASCTHERVGTLVLKPFTNHVCIIRNVTKQNRRKYSTWSVNSFRKRLLYQYFFLLFLLVLQAHVVVWRHTAVILAKNQETTQPRNCKWIILISSNFVFLPKLASIECFISFIFKLRNV